MEDRAPRPMWQDFPVSPLDALDPFENSPEVTVWTGPPVEKKPQTKAEWREFYRKKNGIKPKEPEGGSA